MSTGLLDLFDPLPQRLELAPGAVVLRSRITHLAPLILNAVQQVELQSPFRQMVTPGGFTMSVAMTNCGQLGWVADQGGYRYAPLDPQSGGPWPAMPPLLADLAQELAAEAGFDGFAPDACLMNRYLPGSKLSLHQDKDEQDLSAPIVSLSLGLSASFLWGGLSRRDRQRRIALDHGDVVVWGGPSRLIYHGIAVMKEGEHPLVGRQRLNLTFRRAR